MRAMKCVAGFLLALMLLLTLTANVFADGETTTGTITVTNPMDKQAYTAYKIFDVTYNSDKSAVSYTISKASPWYSVVKDYSGFELANAASDDTRFTVTAKDGFSAAAFSELLKRNVNGKTSITLKKARTVKQQLHRVWILDITLLPALPARFAT